ncbi:HIT family protein [Candidatus Shikimatogenerans silvanidophilus]|uniref:HIT family protein n=1 Tax=Candidatus Shikimatogenerans silvanidophilus TaxID=2782547 RepID=UPI001BAE4879|nr:HIT family protein [Candidatus Shikimatogenerans silvanidophilus]
MNIFKKIILGKLPSYKIYEDENSIAILDIYPIKIGHTIIIPKKNIKEIFNLEKNKYLKLMFFTYKIANAIKKTILCKKVSIVTLGFEINHAHIHLIPINKESDINFKNKKKIKNNIFLIICNSIKYNL